MSRRVPVQPIRGSDPTLLEVQLSEMLRRPLGQLHPVNVMDLIELASTEGCPRSLEKGLQGFVDGVQRQMADIPAGRSWDEFLAEFAELEGSRVPHRFREMLQAESERSERPEEPIYELLERWSQLEPEPFPLGQRVARVQRAEAVQRKRGPAPEPSSAPREGGRRRASGTSRRGAPSASMSGRKPPIADIDRHDFIQDLCLEKLAGASDRGLGEHVLIAGIRHLARDRYPDLLPHEITAILRDLKETNRVRYSAGRWSMPARF